jgi:GNAT superfamily N-acetyltransferase
VSGGFRLSSDLDAVDWRQLAEVFERAPLGRRDPQVLEQLFRNSGSVCLAWRDGELVGAGRALTDRINYAFILDVVVLPEHQGQGHGAAIMRFLMADCGARNQMLHAVPGKEGFYAKLGFRRMTTAMARFDNAEWWRQRGYIE